MLAPERGALEQLLDVQHHDIHLDQLRHRRATLVARTELEAVAREQATLATARASLEAARRPLAREQRAIDDEVSRLRAKVAAEDARLYSGTVTSPKELQAIQEEIAALGRRVGELEDQELELMIQLEPHDAEAARLDGVQAALDGRAASATEQLATDEAGIDAELAAVSAERDRAAIGVAAELLSHYEQLRRALGGVGVARLNASRCEGCHLELSAVEVDRLRRTPGTELAHCEECGRILVV